jgi:hypothetical protein
VPNTCQYAGCPCVFQQAHVTSLDSQNLHFTMSLEALLCPFFWRSTCWRWVDSLVIFLLVFQLKSLLFWFLIFLLDFFVKVLFVINFILQFQSDIIFYNLILILLISIFFSCPFIKFLFVFNFIIQSKFIVYY